MKRFIALLISGLIPLLLNSNSHAASALELLEEKLADDPEGIEAISLYPEVIRTAILEAATAPELIVKVGLLQTRSSATFAELLEDYSREEQEAVWDLVRFPGLLEKLVEGDIKSKRQIERLLKDYPQRIHDTALDYGRKEYDLLVDIHDLNTSTTEVFAQLVEEYPPQTRQSFSKLIDHPEIVSILNEDMGLTVLLGDAYKKNPQQVKQRAAELNLELATEHAAEVGGLIEEMNSEAAIAMEEVAMAYAERYAYDVSNFDGPEDDEVDIEVAYYGRPYPYWLGHPHWYASSQVHASLNWYITPNLYTSVSVSPRLYRHHSFYAPRHHVSTWSKSRAAKPVKVKRSRKHRHRR